MSTDTQLDQLHRFHPEYAGGLSNHGPMAIDALMAIGRADKTKAFAEAYGRKLEPMAVGTPMGLPERAGARGDISRAADWIATYEAQLQQGEWQEVVAAALPELAPGMFAAACHAFLRVAHAVRMLASEDTAIRRRELAHGLGYWAARYQTLPGEPGERANQGFTPAEMLVAMTPLEEDERCGGLFLDAVGPLDGHIPFINGVEELDTTGPWQESLSRLCEVAAQLYLDNPERRIAYCHAVTAPSAMRLVAPYLPEDALAVCLGHATQCAAALHCISAGGRERTSDERAKAEALAGQHDALTNAAACSGDEHSVKLTDALLREIAQRRTDTFSVAAADAALFMRLGAQSLC